MLPVYLWGIKEVLVAGRPAAAGIFKNLLSKPKTCVV